MEIQANKAVIKVEDNVDSTNSGFTVPTNHILKKGVIIDLGYHYQDDYAQEKLSFSVGDKVIFEPQYSYEFPYIKESGETVIIDFNNILAKE